MKSIILLILALFSLLCSSCKSLYNGSRYKTVNDTVTVRFVDTTHVINTDVVIDSIYLEITTYGKETTIEKYNPKVQILENRINKYENMIDSVLSILSYQKNEIDSLKSIINNFNVPEENSQAEEVKQSGKNDDVTPFAIFIALIVSIIICLNLFNKL